MTLTQVRDTLRRAAAIVRRVVGVPDYETYLAHVRKCHVGTVPMTREEFERSQLEDSMPDQDNAAAGLTQKIERQVRRRNHPASARVGRGNTTMASDASPAPAVNAAGAPKRLQSNPKSTDAGSIPNPTVRWKSALQRTDAERLKTELVLVQR